MSKAQPCTLCYHVLLQMQMHMHMHKHMRALAMEDACDIDLLPAAPQGPHLQSAHGRGAPGAAACIRPQRPAGSLPPRRPSAFLACLGLKAGRSPPGPGPGPLTMMVVVVVEHRNGVPSPGAQRPGSDCCLGREARRRAIRKVGGGGGGGAGGGAVGAGPEVGGGEAGAPVRWGRRGGGGLNTAPPPAEAALPAVLSPPSCGAEEGEEEVHPDIQPRRADETEVGQPQPLQDEHGPKKSSPSTT